MRIAIAVVGLLVGCGSPPSPRTVHAGQSAVTFQVDGPGRWIDRPAGLLELRLACIRRSLEVACGSRCERRITETQVACQPGAEVRVITGSGTIATGRLAGDGRATVRVAATGDPSPAAGWRVEVSGHEVAWRGAAPITAVPVPPSTAALAPPASAPPVPPPQTRRYTGQMILLDLVLIATAVPVISAVEERSDDGAVVVAALYVGGYLVGGSVIHGAQGNQAQAGRSVLRRVGYPLLFGIAGGLVGRVLEADCSGEFCGLGTVVAVVLGMGAGGLVAVIHDWSRAHVDPQPGPVVPVVDVGRDGVTVGVGGRF